MNQTIERIARAIAQKAYTFQSQEDCGEYDLEEGNFETMLSAKALAEVVLAVMPELSQALKRVAELEKTLQWTADNGYWENGSFGVLKLSSCKKVSDALKNNIRPHAEQEEK